MPNTSRSRTAQRFNVATAHTDVNPDGLAKIAVDFCKETIKDAANWTGQEPYEKSQEYEHRKATFSDGVAAFYKARGEKSVEETSRRIRQEILDTEDVGVAQPAPVLPTKKRMTTKQLVDEIAANIQFG